MQKSKIFLCIVIIYEVIRTSFMLTSSPIDTQSLSWYTSVPLLCFPVIFCVLLLIDIKKYQILANFVSLSKLTSCISFIFYVIKVFPLSVKKLQFNDYKFFEDMIYILIFFIIDVIIGIKFVNISKKVDSNDDSQEGLVCK